MLINSILQEIKESVMADTPKVGSIEIKLVFHDGKFQKYFYSKREKAIFGKSISKKNVSPNINSITNYGKKCGVQHDQ